MKKVTITVAQLKEMLLNWNFGAQPVSLQYVTSPKLTKEGKAKFGEVTKIANVGGMVGYCYQNSRNNELGKNGAEADFLAQPLWAGKGKRLSLALSTHVEKNSFYLTYKAQQTFKSFHFDSVLNFIPNALIKMYFPQSAPSVHNGVQSEVHHREIALENVKKLKFKGVTYNIVG
jgi:hypothetical protein